MRSHLSAIALAYSLPLILVLALFTPCAPTGASDTPPEAVPPALNFGTVYVGSVVEGGFGIDGTNLVEVKSAPAWITVLEVDPEAVNPAGRGSVELRVDTSSPGVFSGAVVVETEAGGHLGAGVRGGEGLPSHQAERPRIRVTVPSDGDARSLPLRSPQRADGVGHGQRQLR